MSTMQDVNVSFFSSMILTPRPSLFRVMIQSLKGLCLLVLVSSVVTMSEGQISSTGFPSFLAYPHQEAVTLLVQSQNNFTRNLYAQLGGMGRGNLFFSPFSVMAALSMTYGGTGGRTQQQMMSVLHLTLDATNLHNAFHDILSDFKKESPDYELHTSNLAYLSDQLSVLAGFEEVLKEKFLSVSKVVNFGASETVRQDINSVVEQETNSRIKDLLPPGSLDSLTQMVLVNAVYFKGLWDHPFDPSATREEAFWVSESRSVIVPMMHIRHKEYRMAYREDLQATMLAMEYKGSRLSMVFVLPDQREGLAGLEVKLSQMDLLSSLGQDMRTTKVEVTLPRFQLQEALDLVEPLKQMGLTDLFDSTACDLSGISGSRDLSVSRVVHKAFLEVNEQGSEAAAASGVVITGRSMPLTFTLDHPFLFYIRDQTTGILLFAGRVTNPAPQKPKDEL